MRGLGESAGGRDWPDPVPVTEAEIEVFERWFGDSFGPAAESFSPCAMSYYTVH